MLIVGAGPTGLMLACQLALHDISFRIVDKSEDHTTQSRALVVQARSIEIFDQMGLAGKALQLGKIAKAGGAFINGKKAFRVELKNPGEGLTKFPFLLMLEQSQTESLLLEFLAHYGKLVERNKELIDFRQDSSHVTSMITHKNGNEEIIKSKYLVAADGAHSVVRDTLKIPFIGTTYEESLFVLDCKVKIDIPNDEMYLAFAESSFAGFFPLTNGRYRILGNIPKHLIKKKHLNFEDIEPDFAKRIRMNVALSDPQWISAYRSHHRYANTFRLGRCFLAGDAAHIHSPVGAQGMNTGLQDSYNLAWKLALVIKTKAKDSLLDSYTFERIIIAKNLVRTTDKAFKLITSSNILIKTFRLHLMPLIMRVLAVFLQKAISLPKRGFKLVSEIGIDYRNSPLSLNASLGNFPAHSPRPGDRLPYILFKGTDTKEINIQDKIRGSFFHLFLFGDNLSHDMNAILHPFESFFSFELIPRSYDTETLYKKLGIEHQGFIMIRPDMYIAYRATQFDAIHFKNYLSQFLVF